MTNRTRLGWMIGLAATLGASACGTGPGPRQTANEAWDESIAPGGFDASTPRTERVFLAGTLGDVTVASGAGAVTTLRTGTTQDDSELEPGAAQIDVSNPSMPAWMMVRVTATHAFSSVPVGTTLDSDADDDDDDGDSPVDVVGCAGPHPGEYTIDARPDRVRVRVEAGADPDTRLIRFVATFDDRTVQGAYEIEVP